MRDISVRCIYTFMQHISGCGINFLVGINAVSNWYVFGMFVSATTTIIHNIHVYSAYEYDFPLVVEFFLLISINSCFTYYNHYSAWNIKWRLLKIIRQNFLNANRGVYMHVSLEYMWNVSYARRAYFSWIIRC